MTTLLTTPPYLLILATQLRSRKDLQGPTIIEINEESKAKKVKQPPFPKWFQSKPIQREVSQLEFYFFNELRNVNIKIPLLQAIKDIPVYTKTVQDLCTRKKKKKQDPKTIQVIGQLEDIMLRNITIPKYSGPRSPIIKVSIGKVSIPNTLVDLGATINVMKNETKERLSLEGIRPTPTVP